MCDGRALDSPNRAEPRRVALVGSMIPFLSLAAWVGVAAVVLEAVRAPSVSIFSGMFGGMAHALVGRWPAVVPGSTFRLAQAVVGVAAGAAIDVATLWALGTAWFWVLGVTLTTLALSVAIGQVLRVVGGLDAPTAVFASIAGGAAGMASMARDLGADERIVAVVQYVRVLLVLLTLPLVLGLVFPLHAQHVVPRLSSGDLGLDVTYTLAAIVVGLVLGRVTRLPSPAVLGCLLSALVLGAVPAFDGARVPAVVQDAGFLLIGVQVGLRFNRATLLTVARVLPLALGTTVVLVVGCAGLGLLLAGGTEVSRRDAYLATSPGGLPAVLAAAASGGGDLTFISCVQALRIVLVLTLAPVLVLLARRRRGAAR